MSLDTNSTLASLVDAYPSLARELERRGFDYCCGGQQRLADACVAQGLDPAAVASELHALADTTRPEADWMAMSATALADHIVETHHAYLWDEMPRLTALTEKILKVHGDRHPELSEVHDLYAAIRTDMGPHLLKEERILFPLVRQLDETTDAQQFHCGSVRNPISVMHVEHETIGDLLARLRAVTNAYTTPADGCATYEACYRALEQLEIDTHMHVHKENNVLFPMAMRMEAGRV